VEEKDSKKNKLLTTQFTWTNSRQDHPQDHGRLARIPTNRMEVHHDSANVPSKEIIRHTNVCITLLAILFLQTVCCLQHNLLHSNSFWPSSSNLSQRSLLLPLRLGPFPPICINANESTSIKLDALRTTHLHRPS